MEPERDGALVARADDLWTVRTHLRIAVGDIGTRMTVMRLWDGSLLLHSPVEPSPELRKAIDEIGTVRWIVAPSLVHHFFCGHWAEAYPDAEVCAPAGLEKKRKDLEIHQRLEPDLIDRWNGEVEAVLVEGAPRIDEWVFFHPASRSVVFTDVAFNVRSDGRNDARLFHFLVGAVDRFGPHRFVRQFLRDKSTVARSIDRVLEWDFDRVIVTHGEVMETGGHAAVEQAFAYLRG